MDFFRRVNDGKSVQQTLQKEEQLYIKSCISKTAFNMLKVMVHCSAALSLSLSSPTPSIYRHLPPYLNLPHHTLTRNTQVNHEKTIIDFHTVHLSTCTNIHLQSSSQPEPFALHLTSIHCLLLSRSFLAMVRLSFYISNLSILLNVHSKQHLFHKHYSQTALFSLPHPPVHVPRQA